MSDIDFNIKQEYLEHIKRNESYKLIMIVGGDPSSSCESVVAYLKDNLESLGTLNSKYLSVPSIYFVSYEDDFLPNQHTLSGEGDFRIDWDSRTIYLLFDRFRAINPIDPESEWIYLYPIFSCISKWCKEHNIGSITSLSTSIIHYFAENEDLEMLTEGEIYTVDWGNNKVSKNLSEKNFCMIPYMHLPRVFSQITGQQGLNVFAGSIDTPEKFGFDSAHSLMKWLRKNHSLKFTLKGLRNSSKHIEDTYKDRKSVEAFIRSVEPSNNNGNGVMFQ